MNKKGNRRKQIIKLLQMRNGVTIKELAGLFNVSEMTIRRDLQVLESENFVNLVHGAAIYNPQSNSDKMIKEYNLVSAKGKNNEAKNRIGKYAASLIESNDHVIIDTGSTTEKIIPYVDIGKTFSLICYSSNIMMSAITKPNIDIFMGGGKYNPETSAFTSRYNVEYLKRIRATKFFASASGVDLKYGVTCMHDYEIDVKSIAMQASLQNILCVDSSKFGKVTNAYMGELSKFDLIISDKELSQEWIDEINKLKIELVLV